MERSEMTVDQKREALEKALDRTDMLMEDFLDVLRQDFGEKKRNHRDFSSAAQKIVPDEKPEEKPEDKPVGKDDERLHMSMSALSADASGCTRCCLCRTRKNVVFGTGCSDRPLVMVIGEGPGENEDIQGLPFVGKAGQYLDRWLAAITLSRDKNVYITNTVKCRPPQNRDPYPEEKEACFAFLKQQVALIRPSAILCLGKPASTLMTGQPEASMNALHGKFFFYDSIPMICTYHPAAVLRDPALKRPVWDDLKKLARYLGLETGGGKA
ncbi:MAG: uracil-DNA glycosylase [Spirochaetales bacterium]|nr:uracil-DNA glycosylase [Spirochaetales bacterium]